MASRSNSTSTPRATSSGPSTRSGSSGSPSSCSTTACTANRPTRHRDRVILGDGERPSRTDRHPGGGFVGEVCDDGGEVAGAFVDGELAVGAGALAQDRVDVLDVLAGAELVDHVVDELQQLHGELPHRHLGALAEVDQLAVD